MKCWARSKSGEALNPQTHHICQIYIVPFKMLFKKLSKAQLTLVESLTSICANSFPLMLKLQKRPRS